MLWNRSSAACMPVMSSATLVTRSLGSRTVVTSKRCMANVIAVVDRREP
ncbi:hypothetical protein SAMN05421748_126144 [Paractinoplanes atraurantiacus]|uniref:Uncharacterized protein n=1 Tax=Paractinoplanes atraurantiacus TaxID=1036182 RepID=A0A285JVX0_9ACTN|nr:hypothetical protein SAMN05421748_126144 [Actinoplanes atraurantiacus]